MSLLTSAIKTDLYRFFSIAFNAAPGVTYMNQLATAVESGMTVKEIVNVFTTKTEFTSTYPSFYTADQFANKLVETVVGTSATDAAKTSAKADIVAALNAGWSRGDVVYQVFNNLANKAATDADWGATSTQMANKVAVAQYYTEDLLTDSTNLSTLRAVIANVTATTDVSTAAAKQAVLDVAVPAEAQSFTLTTSSDVKTLGAGADTFYGSLTTAGTTDTLTAGDNLNGAGGVDILSVSITGTGTSTSANPTLTNVEKVQVSNAMTNTAGTATFDMSLSDSTVTSVGTTASSTAGATTLFSNVGHIVAAEMRGLGNLTVNYVSSIGTGTGDAMTLTLNGVGASGANATGDTNNKIEKLTLVSSSSSANYLTLGTGADDGTGITISGSSALTLDLGTGGAKSIDASAATAAVTITGVGATNTTITGGSANDSFTFGSGNFNASTGATAQDVINGGAGTDTLVLNQGTGFADTIFGNVTNVETLTLSGTGAVNISTVAKAAGIATVNMNGGTGSVVIGTGYSGSLTVNLGTGAGAASTDSVQVNSSASGVTLTVKGNVSALSSADTLTGSAATGVVDTLTLTADNGSGNLTNATGFEVINILANSTSGSYGAQLGGINGASGKTTTIDASALTNTGAALTIDGSSAAGTLSITAGAGADAITLGTGGGTVTGGLGADTLTGGAGNDFIYGGDGNDSIVAGAGNDYISAGDGNDTITISATGALTTGDTIDGGDGTGDTLVLQSGDTISSSMFTNVTNVEKLNFVGSATLTGNIPFTTFDLSNATGQTLSLGTGYTNATTVTLGDASTTSTGNTVATTADSVTSQGSAALTINASVAALVQSTAATGGNTSGTAYDSAATISGGSGTDTLNLTASFDGNGAATYASTAGSTLVLGTGSALTGIDVVTIVDAGDGTGAGKDIYLTLNTGALAAIKVDASALDDGTGTTNEQLVFDGSLATGNLTIIGGAAADSITGGSGYDSLVGGAGNDVFILGTRFDGNDTVAGGDGTDRLNIEQDTAGVGDLAFLNASAIEKLGIGTGAGTVTLDVRAQAAGITTVLLNGATTGAVTVTTAGFTNAVTFDATANTAATGALKFTGGTVNDTFVFAASGLTSNDSLVGGAGTDTIQLNNSTDTSGTGAGVAVAVTLSSGIVGVENLTVNDLGTGTTGTVSITLDSGFGGTGQTSLTVDASALDSGETLTFVNNGTYTVSSTATYPTVNVTAGAAADTLTGGSGADTLSGGAGADVITGSKGADVLTGGASGDTFVFATGDSTSASTDTIADFTLGTDTIRATISLGAASTVSGYVGSAASNADGLSLLSGKIGEFFYNSTNKQLVMDTDGNGLIQATDTIITLTDATGLSSSAVSFYVTGGTGADTITGGALADSITGGAGADVISGGSGADTITGGAGADVFAFSTDGSVVGTDLDVISDFATGSDIIDFGGTGVLLTAEANGTTATSDVDTTAGGLVTFAAADDTYAEMVVAIQADTQLDAAGSVALFISGSDAYIYYAGAVTGNTDDQIVKLTGMSTLTAIAINSNGDLTVS